MNNIDHLPVKIDQIVAIGIHSAPVQFEMLGTVRRVADNIVVEKTNFFFSIQSII